MTDTENGRHQIKDPSASPCRPTCQLIHLIEGHLISPPPLENMSQNRMESYQTHFFSVPVDKRASLALPHTLTRFQSLCSWLWVQGIFRSAPSTVVSPGEERPHHYRHLKWNNAYLMLWHWCCIGKPRVPLLSIG